MKIFKIFARKRSDSEQCEGICKNGKPCGNKNGRSKGLNQSKFCALHYNGGKKKPIKDNKEVNLKRMKQLPDVIFVGKLAKMENHV